MMMEIPPTKSAVNLEDSGCVVDGLRSALCDEETAMVSINSAHINKCLN